MTAETYKGRKLKVVKDKASGGLVGSVNGWQMPTRYGVSEAQIIEQFHRDIDAIDRDPVVDGDRWGAEWYAPGTYEICGEGIHPVAIGGKCRHSSCVKKRTA